MNRRLASALCAAACLAVGMRALALGPHEVLVLVNDSSPRSVEVANYFIHLRKIPPENVVHLALPPRVLATAANLPREDFTRLIWEPANRALEERRLQDHILAWVYSADFPVLILGSPDVSLLGLTFMRDQLPDAEAIRSGRYASALFAGPAEGDDRKAPTRSLEQYAAYLQTNMPLPSMMLGHTGSRGLTVDGLIALLRYGAMSDGSTPQGDVAFVVSSDIRSTCRSWQYADVIEELQALGVHASVSSNAPGPPHRLIGFMTGTSDADPLRTGVFVPGSMADNLTSYAGTFSYPGQTKMTAWLRAGATASAGTVTEPYAIWTKFPHARFFAHYVAGCSMIEAFFQSIACPLQLQLMGDPLAKPWGKPPGVTLVDLNEEGKPVTGTGDFLASAWVGPLDPPPVLLFLIDGRAITSPPDQAQLRIDTTALSDGYHELRAVAYTRGQVRQQGFDVKGFTVRNHDRGVTLAGLTANEEIDLYHSRAVTVEADGSPRDVALVSQDRELVRKPFEKGVTLTLDPRALGAGPNRIQAAAWYEDGEQVRSAPVAMRVDRLNALPAIESISRTNTEAHAVKLSVKAVDAEHDPITVTWWEDLAVATSPMDIDGGGCEWTNDAWTLSATGALVVATCPDTSGSPIAEVAVDVQMPRAEEALSGQLVGLVFDRHGAGESSFFGWSGDGSAWVLGSLRNAKLIPHTTVGAFIKSDSWHRLRVRMTADGALEALLDDDVIARRKQDRIDGPIGIVGGTDPSLARGLFVSPPAYAGKLLRIEDGEAVVLGGEIPAGLAVRAADAVGGRIVRVRDVAGAQ